MRNSYTVVGRFIVKGKVVALHYVTIPSVHSSKGFYQQTTSYNYFRRREIERMAQKADRYTLMVDENSHDRDEAIFKNSGVPRQIVPTFHHSSMWEFYTAIGYNYKRQLYVKEVEHEPEIQRADKTELYQTF